MDFASLFKRIKLPEFSFFRRPSRVVGIDVGVYSTKIVELDSQGGRAVLGTYGELLSGPYMREGGESGGGFLQYRDDEIIQMLQEVLRASNVKARDAVFGIPSVSAFITTFAMPRLPSPEIEKAIPFEARKYIPVPVKDVVLDWQILGGSAEQEEIDILLVAVPKDILLRIGHIVSGVGLRLRGTEIESFSILRSVLKNEFAPTAIIHIGHQSSTILVTDKSELRMSHNILHGSNEWTRALERGLGVAQERAEEMKKEVGLSDRPEEQEIGATIAPLIDSFFLEADRIFSFYHRKSGRRVQKIEFSGSGAGLKGFISAAVRHFEIESEIAQPFSKVVAPQSMEEKLKEIGPSFTVAVGLALREIASR